MQNHLVEAESGASTDACITHKRKNNVISDDRRHRIITNYQKNMSVKDICLYESLPNSTVHNIINRFRKHNTFAKLKQGGKKYSKITPEIKEYLQKEVDENCTVSLKVLKQGIFDKFGVHLCESTIHGNLKQMHYSLKMLKLMPEKRNDAQTIELRKQYAIDFDNVIDEYADTNVFFIDEVGFNVSMRVNKGRAKIGQTPVAKVKNIRSKNISVCCAYRRSNVFFHEINHSPYNTESFTGYISSLFEEIEALNIGRCMVIMDNVPFHKSNVVKNRFIEKGHSITYLPPYSPMLNPIENVFSKWKNFVKRANCLSEEHLLRSMDQGLQSITREDCEGWFRNMKKYIRLAREGIQILD